MPLFGRKKDDDLPVSPPLDPDPALPALSREDALTIDRLAREAVAQRGVEVTSDGAGLLTAMDGRTYGLSNVAARAAAQSRTGWPELVAGHVEGLLASHDIPEPQSLDEVRTQVYPRLRWSEDLPDLPSYVVPALPGIVVLAAIDYPSHVAELIGDDAVERLGGWPAILEQGITNLRALEPMHHQVLQGDPERDDADVHVLTSDDFFGPSRLLVLDEVMAGLGIPASPHGVLVAVPNRHLLVVHPITGLGVVGAMQLTARISTGECDSQPGAVSPHVYYRPASGAMGEQVTHVDEDGAMTIQVDGALAEAFGALGLLEG